MTTQAQAEWWWKWVLRITGLGGIVYETVVQQADRPWLLLMFGAMVGLANLGPLEQRVLGRSGKDEP